MPTLGRGTIARAEVLDSQGRNPKRRPVIVITSDEEVALNNKVQAVAITTTLQESSPDKMVELPWHRSRHPRTGLTRRAAAVCDWIVEIEKDKLEIMGHVPPIEMEEILKKVDSLSP